MSNDSPKTAINISEGTIIKVILLAALAFVLYQLRDVILIVLTGLVFASFIEPLVIRLKRFGINRTFSVIFSYLILLLVLAGIFYALTPTLVSEISHLSSLISKYLSSSGLLENFQKGALSGAREIISGLNSDISPTDLLGRVEGFLSDASRGFFRTLGTIFGGAINVILILVISFYLSVQEKGVENFLRIIIPLRHESYVINLWQRVQRKIGLWFQGQLLDAVIVGLLTFISMIILGVQYALFISILTILLTIIPFGVILAAVFAVLFAYLGGGLDKAILVALVYFAIQQFEGYVLQPMIIKKVVGIPPLVVILSLLIGAQLAGFWGLILAIPVAVSLLELSSDLEKNRSLKKQAG